MDKLIDGQDVQLKILQHITIKFLIQMDGFVWTQLVITKITRYG
jgi:hypothetical protein